MSEKFYRVKKATHVWEVGAILKLYGESYHLANPIFCKIEGAEDYREADICIEDAEDGWFERVYPVNLLSKTVYKLKEEAKELFAKEYND